MFLYTPQSNDEFCRNQLALPLHRLSDDLNIKLTEDAPIDVGAQVHCVHILEPLSAKRLVCRVEHTDWNIGLLVKWDIAFVQEERFFQHLQCLSDQAI